MCGYGALASSRWASSVESVIMSLTEWVVLVGRGLSWHVPVAEKGYDKAQA